MIAIAGILSLLARLLGFVTGVLSARALGPDLRGELASLITTLSFVSMTSICGADQFVASETGQGQFQRTKALTVGIPFSAVMAGFLVALCWMLVDDVPARILALAIPPILLNYIFSADDQGRMRFRSRGLYLLIGPSFYATALVLLTMFHCATMESIVAAYVAGQYIALFCRAPNVGLAVSRDVLPDRVYLTCFIRRAFSLHLSQLAQQVLLRVDFFVLMAWGTNRQLGIYAVAQGVATALYAMLDPLVKLAFVKWSPSKESNATSEFQNRYKQITRQAWMTLPVGLLVAVIAPNFVVPIYGLEFREAAPVTFVLCLATTFTAVMGMFDAALRAVGKTRPSLIIHVVSIALVAVLGTYFFQTAHLVGVAAALGVGAFVGALLTLRLLRPTT